MLEEYSFRQTQLAYIKGAMDLLTAYRPFGKTPVQVATYITEAEAQKIAFLAKNSLRESGRAGLRLAFDAGRKAAVQVYAMMKSMYSADTKIVDVILRLPKPNNSPAQTLTRMQATAELWSTLPNPPGQAVPFAAGSITLAIYNGLLADLSAAQADYLACTQQFQKEEGNLNEKEDAYRKFISGALTQGRAQFAEGTPARQVIDGIPTQPTAQPPAQSVITAATSPAIGAVHLEFAADHATSFQVWHKGPGEPIFAKVADVLLPGVYDVTGLVAGAHEYQIVGENSRGDGAASVPGSVTVAGASTLPEQPWVSGESQAEGAVHLWYGAEGASTYQVWHKGPGESQFALVDTTVSGEYAVFGLAGGMHAYKAVGLNAAGAGPASEPLAIDVAAVAVA